MLGIDNVPKKGAFILASNHLSFFDPPALGCKLPRNLHYFARDTLFIGPLGALIRSLNSIPVDREKLDLKKNFSAYFVHSYELILEDKNNLILSTEYGGEITAMVKRENIIGTQFHPEKSHLFGLKFLETFIEIT